MGIEMPVQGGERTDAVTRGLELRACFGLADAARLQVQQAGDDLQIIFYSMMDFLHQQLLLTHGGLQAGLLAAQHHGGPAEGDDEEPQVARQRGVLGLVGADVEKPARSPTVHPRVQPGQRTGDEHGAAASDTGKRK